MSRSTGAAWTMLGLLFGIGFGQFSDRALEATGFDAVALWAVAGLFALAGLAGPWVLVLLWRASSDAPPENPDQET